MINRVAAGGRILARPLAALIAAVIVSYAVLNFIPRLLQDNREDSSHLIYDAATGLFMDTNSASGSSRRDCPANALRQVPRCGGKVKTGCPKAPFTAEGSVVQGLTRLVRPTTNVSAPDACRSQTSVLVKIRV